MIIVLIFVLLAKYVLMFFAAAAVSTFLGHPIPSGWAILAAYVAAMVIDVAFTALRKP